MVNRTCFWAGDTFAPKLMVKNARGEDVSIQSHLQESFLNMWELLASTVGDLPAVLGFEVSLYASPSFLVSHAAIFTRTDDERTT